MDEAQNVVRQNGGRVLRFARDAHGKHMGYKLDPKLQKEAMDYFLTPQTRF